MGNYFKDYGPGYRVTDIELRTNEDGSVTRVAKVKGVKVNYSFPDYSNQEILADVTFEFTIPDEIDETNLNSWGPMKFQQSYYIGAWMTEFDVPEQFQ